MNGQGSSGGDTESNAEQVCCVCQKPLKGNYIVADVSFGRPLHLTCDRLVADHVSTEKK